jgi:hypothetical protein
MLTSHGSKLWENCENRNDPDLVQAFLKKWWVEAPLGLSKYISDYLPYFEKINIFFNIARPRT